MGNVPYMPKTGKILVVGTTPDYIDWIQTASPGRALFMTDSRIRKNAAEPSPDAPDELILPLADLVAAISRDDTGSMDRVLSELDSHLALWNQELTGITCYDCEYLELTARIASARGLAYPSVQAVRNCRDKYVAKEIWQKNGVSCPRAVPVDSAVDAVQFLTESEKGIVLKPFCGSGSELVFRCRNPEECTRAFDLISRGLRERQSAPLFFKSASQPHLMMAEQFISGPEYSCDCIIENGRIGIIRLARKIKIGHQPFGTVAGYVLPAELPAHIKQAELEGLLLDGARTLGITRALCMVDFIMEGRHLFLIEMTPRPGGDCLPFLLREAGDMDILSMALDFAGGAGLPVNGSGSFTRHVGLRIHARKRGVFKGYNADFLSGEKRLKQIHFIRKPGHVITLPPDDYDSWLLGHLIIQPDSRSYPETQSFLIEKRLRVDIE